MYQLEICRKNGRRFAGTLHCNVTDKLYIDTSSLRLVLWCVRSAHLLKGKVNTHLYRVRFHSQSTVQRTSTRRPGELSPRAGAKI